MEQRLIDSSKYNIKLYSLDSRYATTRDKTYGEFKIELPHTLKNIMRVRMASAEIPFVEYEFALTHGNTTFAVKVGASPTFTKADPLPNGNYTAAKLMTTVENILKNIHSGFTCTFNSVTGLVTIQNTSVPFSLFLTSYEQEIANRPSDWGLGYNMGFEKGIITAAPATGGGYTMTGVRTLTLQTTQYYLLQLDCPDPVENVIHPTAGKGFIGAFAKVLLKDNAFTFNFDDNSNLLRKEYTFLAPITIPHFTCRLLDAWGERVDMQGMDWSLTLEVTEVVNSRTYSEISKTYGR
jgi:hypothetical protein